MKAYESPRISIFKCEMASRLQATGTPGDTLIPLDCDLTVDCLGNALSSECFISSLLVDFLLVGSTSTQTPVCTITYDGIDYSGCTIGPVAECAEGVYWQAVCLLQCTTTNPVTIQCDGAEQQGACEAVFLIP